MPAFAVYIGQLNYRHTREGGHPVFKTNFYDFINFRSLAASLG
jgi:hypothetical protein